jgi:Ca-activated chloride channel homolog
MTFREPMWLWLLVVAGALAAAYLVAQRRRSRYAVRFATLPMLERVAPKRPGWRRHVPAAAFLCALVLLVLAVARPVTDVQVPRERATVLVALDTSLSMQATDVSPSRIEVAQQAAVDFVQNLPDQFNVGVISFSRAASVVARPAPDREAAVAAIRGLRLDESTAIGEALFTGLESISSVDASAADDPPPARIVLLSDGSNTSGREPLEVARAAAAAAVPVSTIAYGTPDGTISVDGRVTPVPADTDTLAMVAEQTGGTFYEAQSDSALRGVYEDLQSSIGWRTEQREITALLAGLALGVAVAAGALSLLWFARLP